MLYDNINALCEFTKWVRINVGKSASVTIDVWNHSASNESWTEYTLWIKDILIESSRNIHEIIARIPEFKRLCESKMEIC